MNKISKKNPKIIIKFNFLPKKADEFCQQLSRELPSNTSCWTYSDFQTFLRFVKLEEYGPNFGIIYSKVFSSFIFFFHFIFYCNFQFSLFFVFLFLYLFKFPPPLDKAKIDGTAFLDLKESDMINIGVDKMIARTKVIHCAIPFFFLYLFFH